MMLAFDGFTKSKTKSLTLCYSVLHQEKFKSVTITHEYGYGKLVFSLIKYFCKLDPSYGRGCIWGWVVKELTIYHILSLYFFIYFGLFLLLCTYQQTALNSSNPSEAVSESVESIQGLRNAHNLYACAQLRKPSAQKNMEILLCARIARPSRAQKKWRECFFFPSRETLCNIAPITNLFELSSNLK